MPDEFGRRHFPVPGIARQLSVTSNQYSAARDGNYPAPIQLVTSCPNFGYGGDILLIQNRLVGDPLGNLNDVGGVISLMVGTTCFGGLPPHLPSSASELSQCIDFDRRSYLELAWSGPSGAAVRVAADAQLSITENPSYLITKLAQEVVAINVDAGIANSLDSKLDNAIAALDDSKRGDNPSAVNMLSGFISSVEAQRGKKLTNEQTDQLVNAASGIIDALSQP